ncbi:exonuclease domain-containing protein [Asticcacaulis sp. BYS171W]|uniref:Exonuclease domain-containing protein n=1 Tax=Asticcacaulis aquaticus TaxID=2984212 RepID=A0ABT5HNQ7_9CAUL|nr:exonuclease domain-containing protein [Asticcacaulis aquaticus]MDC7681701.1 exonuclease domain-containing protein [Asticcacaulis aquaticus]
MSLFIIDVEADGPCPGLFSMISLGCVRLDRELKTVFKAQFAPISEKWVPGALAVSHISREQHLAYPAPEKGMRVFGQFLETTSVGRPIFVSDNPAFDWQWVNYYFHAFCGENPFGHSARRIGDLYAGLEKDFSAASRWKALRKTKHTHDPLDDAMGNAEALIAISDRFGLKLPGLARTG